MPLFCGAGYVSDVLGELFDLIIFPVKAAGLTQRALDQHAVLPGGQKYRVAPAPQNGSSRPMEPVPDVKKTAPAGDPDALEVHELDP